MPVAACSILAIDMHTAAERVGARRPVLDMVASRCPCGGWPWPPGQNALRRQTGSWRHRSFANRLLPVRFLNATTATLWFRRRKGLAGRLAHSLVDETLEAPAVEVFADIESPLLSIARACGTFSAPPKIPCCPMRSTTSSVSRRRIRRGGSRRRSRTGSAHPARARVRRSTPPTAFSTR